MPREALLEYTANSFIVLKEQVNLKMPMVDVKVLFIRKLLQ